MGARHGFKGLKVIPCELTLVFLRTVAAFTGLQAGLALPSPTSPVLRSVRAQLALTSVARVLLLLEAPTARELVGVQDVQYGERSSPVASRALAKKESELFIYSRLFY